MEKSVKELEKLVRELSVSEKTQPSKENPSGGMSNKYYIALKQLQDARSDSRNSKTNSISIEKISNLSRKERVITSTTHERWERRVFKQVDGMFQNR